MKMRNTLENYGGIIFFYLVIFFGIMALSMLTKNFGTNDFGIVLQLL